MSSDVQMGRSATTWAIAGMVYLEPVRDWSSMFDHPCETVRADLSTFADAHEAIAFSCDSASPVKTSVWSWLKFGEEGRDSLIWRKVSLSHVAPPCGVVRGRSGGSTLPGPDYFITTTKPSEVQ